jgi:integration host factor subunit beta
VIKSQLILRIAGHNPHLFQGNVGKLVAAIFEEVASALARGDRVELRGFGSFSVKRHKSRIARNFKTGATVHVLEKGYVLFKPGHDIRKRINSDAIETV